MGSKNKKPKSLPKGVTRKAPPPVAEQDIPLGISPEIYNNLQPEAKAELRAMMQYQGPIPDPHSLGLYEDKLPGAAEWLIAMAERESENRHAVNLGNMELNQKHLDVVESQISDNTILNKRAQDRAFILGILGMAGGIYLVRSGTPALVSP